VQGSESPRFGHQLESNPWQAPNQWESSHKSQFVGATSPRRMPIVPPRPAAKDSVPWGVGDNFVRDAPVQAKGRRERVGGWYHNVDSARAGAQNRFNPTTAALPEGVTKRQEQPFVMTAYGDIPQTEMDTFSHIGQGFIPKEGDDVPEPGCFIALSGFAERRPEHADKDTFSHLRGVAALPDRGAGPYEEIPRPRTGYFIDFDGEVQRKPEFWDKDTASHMKGYAQFEVDRAIKAPPEGYFYDFDGEIQKKPEHWDKVRQNTTTPLLRNTVLSLPPSLPSLFRFFPPCVNT